MSDALTYLAKARPDAMGHYFAFLKAAGSHLEPKTKALISVIAKVHAQTERGFKQYLKRALNEGCTPMEVLDALLMAFPILGLSKIVWAADQILAMGLPGFDLAALTPSEPRWHDVAATRSLKVGEVRRVECEGKALFVCKDSQGWRAYDALCPHQATPLTADALEGQCLTCPQHQWAFDMRTGQCTANGNRPLHARQCKVEAGRLWVQW